MRFAKSPSTVPRVALAWILLAAPGGYQAVAQSTEDEVRQPQTSEPGVPDEVADEAPRREFGNPFEAYRAGEWDQALEGFVELQVERPDDPETAYDIGNTQFRRSDFTAADESYTAAAAAGDRELRAEALYNLGNSAYRQGRLEEAVEQFRSALEENPEDQDAKFNLEFVREEIRRRQEQADSQQQPQGEPQPDGQGQEGEPQQGGEQPDSQESSQQDDPPQDQDSPPQQPQEDEPQDPGQQKEDRQPEASEAAANDQDQDGLPDETERNGENPTDPADRDSDDDGLSDGEEDRNANGRVDPGETDPNRQDSDGDGVGDGQQAGAPPPDGPSASAEGVPGELTPEQAERFLQALEDGRPPHRAGEARGRVARGEKDW